ncbi:unnamed protein product, partial [Allacma fusca]
DTLNLQPSNVLQKSFTRMLTNVRHAEPNKQGTGTSRFDLGAGPQMRLEQMMSVNLIFTLNY